MVRQRENLNTGWMKIGEWLSTHPPLANRIAALDPALDALTERSSAGTIRGLAIVGTVFIVLCLWIIEGFEPQTRVFELSVKMGDKTQDMRPKIEEVLRRYKARYELRTAAEDMICYMVTTPRLLRTDRVSNAIMELDPEGKGSVEWNEKPKDKLPK